MAIDKKLNILLKDLTKNSRNSLSKQTVITINHAVKEQSTITSTSPDKKQETTPIVSLYFGDKYAQFYNGFPQTAWNNPKLKPLVDYLVGNNWETNLD